MVLPRELSFGQSATNAKFEFILPLLGQSAFGTLL